MSYLSGNLVRKRHQNLAIGDEMEGHRGDSVQIQVTPTSAIDRIPQTIRPSSVPNLQICDDNHSQPTQSPPVIDRSNLSNHHASVLQPPTRPVTKATDIRTRSTATPRGKHTLSPPANGSFGIYANALLDTSYRRAAKRRHSKSITCPRPRFQLVRRVIFFPSLKLKACITDRTTSSRQLTKRAGYTRLNLGSEKRLARLNSLCEHVS